MSADYSNISWPGWETVDLIGRGSFGAVYKIERKVFNDTEKAALKVISIPQNSSDIEEMYSDGYDNESITSTFQSHLESIVAEYSLMRKMNGCANIVNCDDVRYVQHDDGIGWDIFIKMELLTPLAKSLPAEISDEMVIKIAKDMCRALELCKKHGIVHRDIKPQNIFVSEHGDYKLGDFGIAKTVEKTTGGTKIGTYKYMAPEVYNNQPYGHAADIYSLGLVLYWLLNEKKMPFLPLPPAKFTAVQDEDARHRRLSGEKLPAPAHGSDELKRIVLKACAYDPADRYLSATAMLKDLNDIASNRTAVAPVVDPTPAPSPDDSHVNPQEDDLTTGPIFADTQKENTLSEDQDSDATIGPEFDRDTTLKKKGASEELDKPKKEKPSFVKYALIALGIVVVVIILLLLKTCTGPANSGTDSTTGSGEDTSATTGDTTGESTGMQQVDWSDWQDSLPDYVTAEDYEIEEQEVWKSIMVVDTTSSTTQKTMDGWEMYQEAKADSLGPWSQWSPNKGEEKEGREFEQKQCYSFCNKQTTTAFTSSLNGWTYSDTTYIWGEYSETWTESLEPVYNSDSRLVQTKTQYNYRSVSYSTEYSKWSEWSSWQDSAIEETELKDVETQTVYPYYYFYCWNCRNNGKDARWPFCSGNCGQCGTPMSIEYASVEWYPTPWENSIYWPYSSQWGEDKYYQYINGSMYWNWTNGNPKTEYKYRTRGTTQKTSYGEWSGWTDKKLSDITNLEEDEREIFLYKDRERVPVYHFWRYTGNWSAWDPTPQTETDTLDIQQKLCYRYRDKLAETTYYFRKWSDWEDSEWTPNEIAESDTVKVQKKTQYRFKPKVS